jgi:SAM-dependent methyltransferase
MQSSNNKIYSGSEELLLADQYLPNYSAHIVEKFSHYGGAGADILDFGAGVGTLAVLWEKLHGVKPECVEIDPRLRDFIQQRHFLCYEHIDHISKKFDVIYSSNVLEHINDDLGMLKVISQKLSPQGVLLLYVPAFQILYSNFDKQVGHYRRYEKSELINKLKRANFSTEHIEYADSIGFIAWLFFKYVNNGRSSENSNHAAKMKFYDRYLFPISRLLDSFGLKRILGKNILVVARKIS